MGHPIGPQQKAMAKPIMKTWPVEPWSLGPTGQTQSRPPGACGAPRRPNVEMHDQPQCGRPLSYCGAGPNWCPSVTEHDVPLWAPLCLSEYNRAGPQWGRGAPSVCRRGCSTMVGSQLPSWVGSCWAQLPVGSRMFQSACLLWFIGLHSQDQLNI